MFQRVVPIDVFFKLARIAMPGKNSSCNDARRIAVADFCERFKAGAILKGKDAQSGRDRGYRWAGVR